MFVQEQVVSFIAMSCVVGVVLLFLFLKKPKWLGEDFADMQKEIIKMAKGKSGKGNGKKRKMMEEELKMQHDNDIPTVTEPINE